MQSDVDSSIRVEDSPIMMTATVNNNDVNYDLTQDDEWECDNAGSCTRSWAADQFTGDGETSFSSTHLILKKQIALDCTTAEIGGITICIEQGPIETFKCKYPLETKTVSNTYDATGNNNNNVATGAQQEGTGTLNYKLIVADTEIKIGDEINAEVVAVNEGLVWHTLQDCTVSKDGKEVSILNWYETDNNLVTNCPNYVNAFVTRPSDDKVTTFGWSAFKWLTSDSDDKVDMESQTIECKISLSQDEQAVNSPTCDDSYEKRKYGCYKKAYKEAVSPNSAEYWCQADGAFVPVPTNAGENEELRLLVNQLQLPTKSVILGISDEKTEGKWVNVNNNNEIVFTMWHFLAKQNGDQEVNYATFNGDDGSWSTVRGDGDPGNGNWRANFLVCQKPIYLC